LRKEVEWRFDKERLANTNRRGRDRLFQSAAIRLHGDVHGLSFAPDANTNESWMRTSAT
jgi:hypothetical protein